MTIFCFSFYLLTILYWDYKGLFPLTQLCKNAVPCKSTRHTHSALFDGKVFLLKKATCWRHVFRDKWKSSLWRCGSISRCSAVLDLVCVSGNKLLIKSTQLGFPQRSQRSAHYRPCACRSGNTLKEKRECLASFPRDTWPSGGIRRAWMKQADVFQ